MIGAGMGIRGEKVVVKRTSSGGVDPMGNPLPGQVTAETVDNVLVAPGPRSDLDGQGRENGDRVVYNLHFPKPYKESLRNATVVVRGEEFKVRGDPKPYTMDNCPTPWWMPVEVETVKG